MSTLFRVICLAPFYKLSCICARYPKCNNGVTVALSASYLQSEVIRQREVSDAKRHRALQRYTTLRRFGGRIHLSKLYGL